MKNIIFHVTNTEVLLITSDGLSNTVERLKLPQQATSAMVAFAHALMGAQPTPPDTEAIGLQEQAVGNAETPASLTSNDVTEAIVSPTSPVEDQDEAAGEETVESEVGFAFVGGEWVELSKLNLNELLELLVEALREPEVGLTESEARQAVEYWRDGDVDLSCYPSVCEILLEIPEAERWEAENQQPAAKGDRGAEEQARTMNPPAPVAGKRPKGPQGQHEQRCQQLANALRDDGVDAELAAIVAAVKRGDYSHPRLSAYPKLIGQIRELHEQLPQSASPTHSQQRSATSTKELTRLVKMRLHHDLGYEFSRCDRMLKDLSDDSEIWTALEQISDTAVRQRTIQHARDLQARRATRDAAPQTDTGTSPEKSSPSAQAETNMSAAFQTARPRVVGGDATERGQDDAQLVGVESEAQR